MSKRQGSVGIGTVTRTALLILAGVVAFALLARHLATIEGARSRSALRTSATAIASTLQLAIEREDDLVVSAGGFVAADPRASNAQFVRWADSVRALQRYPEIQGFGHSVIVPAAQLPAFAASALRDPAGAAPADGVFRVLPPGPRPFYCLAIDEIARDPSASFPAGYDFCASEPLRSASLGARDSGLSAYVPIQAGPATLLSDLTPVYRDGVVPASVAARRSGFLGWIGMAIYPETVLKTALAGHPHTSVTFRYHAGSTHVAFRAGTAPAGSRSTALDLHNGWQVSVAESDGSAGILGSPDALITLIGGIALTVLAALLDIAHRRRSSALSAQRVLRESERRLDALLQNSSDMVTVVARDGTVLYQTGAVQSVLGPDSAALEGRNLGAWVDPADHPVLRRLFETTGATTGEIRLRRTDGSSRHCDVHATSLLEDPAWRGVVLTIRDVTDRRRLEQELRVAQKLESVGQLASGIAHEINTPIQYVSSSVHYLDTAFADLERLQALYAELRDAARAHAVNDELLARIEDGEEDADLEYLRERVPQAIARSLGGLGRVANIVAAMRAFGGSPSDAHEPVDINEAIRTTLAVAVGEYKYVADIESNLHEIPPALANAGDINQVLLNLIVNAAHAIDDVTRGSDERGTITIETYADRDRVVVSIADTGCGIPDAIAERVFDPFFTTKEVGRGTGQGLAISRAIMDRHDGRLSFSSRAGGGTTFTISLPRFDPPAGEPLAAGLRPSTVARIRTGTELDR